MKGFHTKFYWTNEKKPSFQVKDLVLVADLRKTCSKGDTTNWSYKLYKITEISNDTKPSYHIDNLPKPYNEALLKKTELSMKENKAFMEALNLIEIKMALTIT